MISMASSVRTVRTSQCTTMTEYDPTFTFPIVFPNEPATGYIAEVLAANGLTNLRLAETEKYAHVTYFFNGGREAPYEGEDRVLVPSPKVPTYDLKPEMSAEGIADALIADVAEKKHDVIICNFANPDMVGHTGSLEAAIAAIKTVDGCLGRVIPAILAAGGTAHRHRRSWQRGADVGLHHERAAHRAHDEPGAGHPGGRSGDRQSAAARDRRALRHRADDAGAAGAGTVEGDDGEGSAKGVERCSDLSGPFSGPVRTGVHTKRRTLSVANGSIRRLKLLGPRFLLLVLPRNFLTLHFGNFIRRNPE